MQASYNPPSCSRKKSLTYDHNAVSKLACPNETTRIHCTGETWLINSSCIDEIAMPDYPYFFKVRIPQRC